MSSSFSTPPRQNRVHHRRTSSGWSETAVTRPANTPLLAFAVDPKDETRDALTATGKSSAILTECVDAVNSFATSQCFKTLLRSLLTRSTVALSVELAQADDDRLTGDYLYAAITDKLQLSITADSCTDKAHIMETEPGTGAVRIDHDLLLQLCAASSQPTGGAAPVSDLNVPVLKALVMVKLLHEVAHQHTRGLMFHIRDACRLFYPGKLISDHTPIQLCSYTVGREPRKSDRKGKLIRRGEMGEAMETALLGSYSLSLGRHFTSYAELTRLLAHSPGSAEAACIVTPAGISRLQPECFTAQCADSRAFFLGGFLERDVRKRRSTGETRQGEMRCALKYDQGDDVAHERSAEGDGEEQLSTDSDSDDGFEVRRDLHWPRIKG